MCMCIYIYICIHITMCFFLRWEARSDAGTGAVALHSAKGGAVETGCSDLYGVIY